MANHLLSADRCACERPSDVKLLLSCSTCRAACLPECSSIKQRETEGQNGGREENKKKNVGGEEKIKERDFWVMSGKVESKVSPEERM